MGRSEVTPAMAAGITDKLMGFEDIVALIDAVAPMRLYRCRDARLQASGILSFVARQSVAVQGDRDVNRRDAPQDRRDDFYS